jgi:hypothetical protein
VRFAIFVMMLIANFAESNFAWMTPLGFLFLVAAIGDAKPQPVVTGFVLQEPDNLSIPDHSDEWPDQDEARTQPL